MTKTSPQFPFAPNTRSYLYTKSGLVYRGSNLYSE
jgi:hypothetical protein